jgi:hypothetical protein
MSRIWVATRKGLFVFHPHAGRWDLERTQFLGDQVTAVLEDPRDGTVWAALGHGHFGGKLHRSTDRGATFTEVAAPKYPPKPEDVIDLDPMRKQPVPWAVQMIWALEAGHSTEPATLWCGTLPGGLFKSIDGGGSWSLVRALWDHPARKLWFGGGYDWPGIHTICVDPRAGGRALIGVSCGGAWETLDGGESWALRTQGMFAEYLPPDKRGQGETQDPHRLSRCSAEPDVVWCQHHNGAFRSTDGGQSWLELKVAPSSFGFAVAAHPKDPHTAWFVPAVADQKRVPVDGRVVVSCTRDGGKSFEVVGRGLPSPGWDLIYRHGLAVDATGERLAMGSTSGSLWVSDDGGASFQLLTAHLPPVFAVRFGT